LAYPNCCVCGPRLCNPTCDGCSMRQERDIEGQIQWLDSIKPDRSSKLE
jgi:hypothetical protein